MSMMWNRNVGRGKVGAEKGERDEADKVGVELARVEWIPDVSRSHMLSDSRFMWARRDRD